MGGDWFSISTSEIELTRNSEISDLKLTVGAKVCFDNSQTKLESGEFSIVPQTQNPIISHKRPIQLMTLVSWISDVSTRGQATLRNGHG